ncbi:MAG: cob(I)yrinic acid a,c-diamide adenosyltransferase [Candidatus Diapherotrites archaeon]|nr:cob(I)yrinic acid a,c-diamide adenosyltransferase [Candidatus Diapherotrites archaeon]
MSEHKSSFGLVQVFWGNGKGKTTSALGQILRCLGRGFKVHLIQFMKGGISTEKDFEEYGELSALKKFPNFSHERFGLKEWVIGKPKPEHIAQALRALEAANLSASSGKFDVIVVDEILYAVQMGLLSEENVLELVSYKSAKTELILTGSHKPLEKIFEKADLVSEIKKWKHPFDKGIPARIGTEF